jgi:hypothetical protein
MGVYSNVRKMKAPPSSDYWSLQQSTQNEITPLL